MKTRPVVSACIAAVIGSVKTMNSKVRSLLAVLSAGGIVATLTGCHTPANQSAASAPCMALLDRFTAADVPAMGPDEMFSPAGKWTNGLTPPDLPGNGLAEHPMLCVGVNYDKM
jgi:hypothetical protein